MTTGLSVSEGASPAGQKPVVALLLSLLSSPYSDARERAAGTLGNLSVADSWRDELRRGGNVAASVLQLIAKERAQLALLAPVGGISPSWGAGGTEEPGRAGEGVAGASCVDKSSDSSSNSKDYSKTNHLKSSSSSSSSNSVSNGNSNSKGDRGIREAEASQAFGVISAALGCLMNLAINGGVQGPLAESGGVPVLLDLVSCGQIKEGLGKPSVSPSKGRREMGPVNGSVGNVPGAAFSPSGNASGAAPLPPAPPAVVYKALGVLARSFSNPSVRDAVVSHPALVPVLVGHLSFATEELCGDNGDSSLTGSRGSRGSGNNGSNTGNNTGSRGDDTSTKKAGGKQVGGGSLGGTGGSAGAAAYGWTAGGREGVGTDAGMTGSDMAAKLAENASRLLVLSLQASPALRRTMSARPTAMAAATSSTPSASVPSSSSSLSASSSATPPASSSPLSSSPGSAGKRNGVVDLNNKGPAQVQALVGSSRGNDASINGKAGAKPPNDKSPSAPQGSHLPASNGHKAVTPVVPERVSPKVARHVEPLLRLVDVTRHGSVAIATNASLCLAELARDKEGVAALCSLASVTALVRLMAASDTGKPAAYKAQLPAARKNAAIALARMAQHEGCLELIREMKGIEMMHSILQDERRN